MDLDFNISFNFSVIAMRLNRSHPDIPKDRKWLMQFVLMHGIFTFVFILVGYSTIFYEFKMNNVSQACANSVIGVLYIIVTFCYGLMLWHRQSLMFMINIMQRDYSLAKSMSSEERSIFLAYAKRGKKNITLWVVIACSCALMFPMKSICLMIYYLTTGDFRLVPLYELTYPAALEKTRDNLVSFVFLYLSMLWYCIYTSLMVTGLFPLGPMFMLHACGQLDLIKTKIQTLFPDHDYNSKAANEMIKEIVIHLQNVYNFVKHIKGTFRVIYELSLKGTTIAWPLLIYEIIETAKHGQLSMEFVTLAVGSIILSSSPCYYSNLLIESSESMRQAVYTSGWEKQWDRRARSMLLSIMIRTIRPVAIRTMFQNLCLEALTDVFQQAYKIFNLINTIW